MSIQEISIEISRLSIEQQLHLLEILSASLRAHWTDMPQPQLETSKPLFDDTPLRDLIGIGQSNLGDLASRHDDYLYGEASASLHK